MPRTRGRPWSGFYAVLRRPVPFEEVLQDLVTYVASATPLHSLAFVSLQAANEGEAIAAVWKGTLPKLSAKALADARTLGGPGDVAEGGARLKIFPVPRPVGDPVGVLGLPADSLSDPALFDFAAHAAAAVGFVHAERSEAAFGERAAVSHGAPPVSAGGLDDPLAALVGASIAMQNLKASLSRVASARAPLLLVGDVGSGKTLVAETLHALSPRRARPLVRVSATAASPQGLEEDLLGLAVPAGDRRRRAGRLFEADGGTLLIEEGRDLSRADAGAPLPAPRGARGHGARGPHGPAGRARDRDDVRPLTRAVEDGHFRDDLYFRLRPHAAPASLKDRKEDIPALLDSRGAARRSHGGALRRRGHERPLNYQYPGNVRELENEVRRLAAQVGAGAVALPDVDQKFSGEHVELALKESDDLKEIVEKVERQVIERVMRKVRGNQSLGARLLNISRGSLIAKMKEYDIKDFRYLKRGD